MEKKEDRKKILIAGFEGDDNSAKILLDDIRKICNKDSLYLKNDFEISSKQIEEKLLNNYDYILIFGQKPDTKMLYLENNAILGEKKLVTDYNYDILKELEKPSRDPRESMPAPILRSDVMDMKDLKPGMILKGTVRNVIDFGVFVDIGVHQDGLVHISQITDRFIKHPLEAVSVGDIVEVQVLSVDVQKKRISLTMRIGQEQQKKS